MLKHVTYISMCKNLLLTEYIDQGLPTVDLQALCCPQKGLWCMEAFESICNNLFSGH
jgi:hypothetical protein